MTSGRSQWGLAPVWEARVGRVVGAYALILALLGGALLTALALMTIVSVIGRSAFTSFGILGAVHGDYDMVSVGTAIAIFSFLPYTQFRRGHVAVEVATNWASPRTKAFFAILANILMTAAVLLVAWRLHVAMDDKIRNGQTLIILGVPTWWGYAASVVGAWSAVLVSLYTVWRSLNEWLGDGEPPHIEGEAEIN